MAFFPLIGLHGTGICMLFLAHIWPQGCESTPHMQTTHIYTHRLDGCEDTQPRRNLPAGTSGMEPGWMRRDDFHFLAAPAPACCSNWVQECSRSLSWGRAAHSLHRHSTRWRPSRKMPWTPAQMMGTCDHGNV